MNVTQLIKMGEEVIMRFPASTGVCATQSLHLRSAGVRPGGHGAHL